MKIRFLMICVLVVGLSVVISLFMISGSLDEKIPKEDTESIDDRESLKEVVYANTICSNFWRTDLFEMWDDKTYDYKNDPIFQECLQVLEFEKYANTSYNPNPEQLKTILDYCVDSKELVDSKDLSYSNETHYIDTVSCEWQDLDLIKNNPEK